MTDTQKNAGTSLPRRLFWFFGLWLAGVISVGALAYAIRTASKLF